MDSPESWVPTPWQDRYDFITYSKLLSTWFKIFIWLLKAKTKVTSFTFIYIFSSPPPHPLPLKLIMELNSRPKAYEECWEKRVIAFHEGREVLSPLKEVPVPEVVHCSGQQVSSRQGWPLRCYWISRRSVKSSTGFYTHEHWRNIYWRELLS